MSNLKAEKFTYIVAKHNHLGLWYTYIKVNFVMVSLYVYSYTFSCNLYI